jgi:single-strand DNA-binding protein
MSTDLAFCSPSTAAASDPATPHVVNLVFLTGALTEPAEPRELAGGIHVVRWTLRVARPAGQSGTDLLDCVALDDQLQQRALAWPIGLPIAVVGSVRRRFFRAAGRTATRVEIEVERVTELDQETRSDTDA